MASARDRCAGMVLGLQAGDRNGGPLELMHCLGESLHERGTYDALDAGRRYLVWFAAGGPAVWDAGPTALSVLRAAAGGPGCLPAAASRYDQEVHGRTAGANTAHRAPALAALHGLRDDEVAAAAVTDAALTHASPLASAASAAVALICRRLIEGDELPVAVAFVARHASLAAPPAAPVRAVLLGAPAPRSSIKPDGFCVNTLEAALHFSWRAEGFAAALSTSIQFAGGDNYCPVLVGAFLGATFGSAVIPATLYDKTVSHGAEAYARWRGRSEQLAARLAAAWPGPAAATAGGTAAALPEHLLGYILSFLHALLLAGPVASASSSVAAHCASGVLCEHVFARDLAAEETIPLPAQPMRHTRPHEIGRAHLQLLPADVLDNRDLGATHATRQLRSLAVTLRGYDWTRVGLAASREGRPELLLWAVRRGGRAEDLDGAGSSALMVAASANRPVTVQAAAQVCDLEQVRGDFGTALHSAAYVGAAAAVAALCGAGARLEVVNRSFGQTPLLVSCSRGHADVVRVLLAARADSDARDWDGLTAEHLADRYGNPAVVQMLRWHRQQQRA